MIRDYEQMIKDGIKPINEHANERLIEVKRAVRAFFKRVTANAERHIVKDYGIDGYIELVEMPETVTTAEQAEAYFNANMEIPYHYTYYDCTGQLFTNWHKLVNRRGTWFVYHCIACDV